ncbi:MAG TPA: ion transporter [Flavobacteriales bacterium]
MAGSRRRWKERRGTLGHVIYGSDTKAGRWFDIWLLWLIVASIAVVMLESVEEVRMSFGRELRIVEWFFTILFTVEFGLRIWTAKLPWRYLFSFYGVMDLLAVLPTWLGLIFPIGHSFMMVRALRLTRVFRILGLFDYVREARLLLVALLASRHRIIVFMLAVLALVSVFGTVMFLIEPPEAGFSSIPRSIYWAIVTLTTVGYGDIAPVTPLGQVVASMIMILGYAIIAIPTGIVTVEMARQNRSTDRRICVACGAIDHLPEAKYCHHCGLPLDQPKEAPKGATDDQNWK